MNNMQTPPHLAESLITLWEELQSGNSPEKIELKLEDDNSITWDVKGLIDSGKEFGGAYHVTNPQNFGLPQGGTYSDLARKMAQMM